MGTSHGVGALGPGRGAANHTLEGRIGQFSHSLAAQLERLHVSPSKGGNRATVVADFSPAANSGHHRPKSRIVAPPIGHHPPNDGNSLRPHRWVRGRIAPHIKHTPQLTSRQLSERTGFDVRMKAESDARCAIAPRPRSCWYNPTTRVGRRAQLLVPIARWSSYGV